jgi:hypothetical protein
MNLEEGLKSILPQREYPDFHKVVILLLTNDFITWEFSQEEGMHFAEKLVQISVQ